MSGSKCRQAPHAAEGAEALVKGFELQVTIEIRLIAQYIADGIEGVL